MPLADVALGTIIVMGAIALAALVPALLRLAILPAVVLELLFGVVIGPQGLGLVAPNPLLDTLSEFGLAVLFLIAGLEINPAQLRGTPTRLALQGWAASLGLALALAFAGQALGLFPAAGFVAIAIATTAIGTLMPILKDQGLLGPPYGPHVLACGTAGEALPLAALSLILAGAAGFGTQGLILVGFALVSFTVIALAGRVKELPMPGILRATMSSASQFPVRLSLFLAVAFALIGTRFELDLILGAFVAGAVMRALLPEDLHDDLMTRLSAVGYGLLIPIFFVTSGMKLDVAALAASPAAVALVPVFVVLMLVVRGAPVLWLHRAHLSLRARLGLGLHCGTQLPLVVAVTALAVERGVMPGWCAAALVTAAVVTVILFPALASLVLRGAGAQVPDRRA